MTRPWADFRASQPRQFLHQKCIRQPVKSIASHPLRFVAARNRQHARHARQIMVKSRVETRHLRQVGKAAMKRLDQKDLFRQMFRIEWGELAAILRSFPQ